MLNAKPAVCRCGHTAGCHESLVFSHPGDPMFGACEWREPQMADMVFNQPTGPRCSCPLFFAREDVLPRFPTVICQNCGKATTIGPDVTMLSCPGCGRQQPVYNEDGSLNLNPSRLKPEPPKPKLGRRIKA